MDKNNRSSLTRLRITYKYIYQKEYPNQKLVTGPKGPKMQGGALEAAFGVKRSHARPTHKIDLREREGGF